MTLARDRQALVKQGLEVWRIYGADYRNLIPRYEWLLAEKRRLKISPVGALRKTDIREFPKIPLLSCETEEIAVSYLAELPDWELMRLPSEVTELLTDNYTVLSLRSFIAEATYLVKVKNKPRMFYNPKGFDPRSKLAGQMASI